ncbi:hypothetical protein B0H63DRAFT_490441 [Podospora didyma]|uniref:Uncharacterized protein n=1 Tax=Podospora didyma TaxID=330526 RepID=A0AAE0N0S9_9PEZI|nr:hypothetical protein B0H63DRAFT_490441 [Podospora didyma]
MRLLFYLSDFAPVGELWWWSGGASSILFLLSVPHGVSYRWRVDVSSWRAVWRCCGRCGKHFTRHLGGHLSRWPRVYGIDTSAFEVHDRDRCAS